MNQRHFLGLFFLLLGPLPAFAQTATPRIADARLGFPAGDAHLLRAGGWLPVYVDVEAGSQALTDGQFRLVVTTPDCDDSETRFTTPLPAMPANDKMTIIASTRLGSAGSTVTVAIQDAAGAEIASTRPSTPTSDALAPGAVLSLWAGSTPPEEASDGTLRRAAFVQNAALLPTQWVGYAALDLVVLHTADARFTADLLADRDGRVHALAEWVRRGGKLIVSAGQNADQAAKVLAELRLVPVSITGGRQLPFLRSVQSWVRSNDPFGGGHSKVRSVPVAQFRVTKDIDVILAESADDPNPKQEQGDPLIVQAACGLGRVLLVAFDLDAGSPFAAWPGQAAFWRRVLQDMEPRTLTEQGGVFNQGWGGDGNEVGTWLKASLDVFPDVTPVSYSLVGGFLLLYILVIGPLDYWFLKKIVKRLEFTYVTFPVILAGVSVGAYYSARAYKGDELHAKKVDVVDIDLRGGRVNGAAWFSVFSPRNERYDVGMQPTATRANNAALVVSWFGRPENVFGGIKRSGSQTLLQRSYDYADQGAGLEQVPVPIWSSRSFTATWEAALDKDKPLFAARLAPARADATVISGTLTSGLPADLRDVGLFFRGKYYAIERLPPGVPWHIDDLGLGRFGKPRDQWFQRGPADKAAARGGDGVSDSDAINRLMRPLLFHDAEPNRTLRNTDFRALDQSWRVQDRNQYEVLLVGRMAAREGTAEELHRSGVALTDLLLGEKHDAGKPPPSFRGTLSQETYVRVFIPVD
jgi:hypothetical protein